MAAIVGDGANRPATGGGRRKMLTTSSGSGSSAKQSSEEGAARGVLGWKDKGSGQTEAGVISALRRHRTPRRGAGDCGWRW